MIIWLYAIFGNEAELMPFFLRHYAPLCDRLTLFNNGSTDSSADLIRAYPNTIIKPYPTKRAVLEAKRMAAFASIQYKEARGKADYVIWVDCDEFLWSGIVSLPEILRGYQAQNIRAVKPHGYQMLSDTFPQGDGQIVDQIHCGVRDGWYDKMCIFDPLLDLNFNSGRHHCYIGNDVTAYQSEIRLLHYRYLGEDFFRRRNAYNNANLSDDERFAGHAYHCAPDYVSGKYSEQWYKDAMTHASDVVNENWIGV